jgi:uncharacterized protein (DUF1778 family)
MQTRSPSEGQPYARLSCRVSARIKHRAEEAASLLGQSITDFTEAALAEKAQTVLDMHARITLSERDFARFVELIDNPKPPTPELVGAMAEYQRLKAANPQSNL